MIGAAPKKLPNFREHILNTVTSGYLLYVSPEAHRRNLDLMQYDIVVCWNGNHHFCPTKLVKGNIRANWAVSVSVGLVENARVYLQKAAQFSPDAKDAMKVAGTNYTRL